MSNVKKIGMNSFWFLVAYAFRLITTFITSVMVARYLGPELFGEMNYVFSYVILFSVMTGTCFNALLQREFVVCADRAGEYLGTTMILRICGAVMACCFLLVSRIFQESDPNLNLLLLIYSISLFFTVGSTMQVLLEANFMAKYVAISEFIQVSVFFALKLLFVFQKTPLHYFVALQACEVLLRSLIQYYFVIGKQLIPKLSFSAPTAGYMMRESWPLFLSGGAIMVYQRVDQVMLRSMVSAAEVGVYAVAVKMCSFIAFLPQILNKSLFPVLTKAHGHSVELFEKRIKQYFALMFWGMASVAVILSILIPIPFKMMYGAEYVEAIPVIRILLWKNVFLGIGLVSGAWIIISRIQKFAPIKSIVSMSVNVIFNLYLIEILQSRGAAFASLISVISYSVILLWIMPPFRRCFVLLVRGVIFFKF